MRESLTSNLKPCPFCGGAPVFEADAARKYVWCSVCEADATWDEDAETAIAAWNLRTTPEARESYLSGWVIEGAWSPFYRPEYWAGSSIWSADAYKALRFATRESAQQAAGLMCAGVNVRIACHEFAEE